LRFSTKTNSDGYMNFWKRVDNMSCEFMIDENGVFCSHLDYKYHESCVPINCKYNQAIKDIKEDLRKKEDIEKLKEQSSDRKKRIEYLKVEVEELNEQMNKIVDLKSLEGTQAEIDIQEILNGMYEEDEDDEEYMYDVINDDTTYYLGDSLDEARKHAQGRGLKIRRYIVEDGEPNFAYWDIVE
jgi:seryl-tRNA synthetase